MAFAATSLGPRQGVMSIDDIIAEAEAALNEYTPAIRLRSWLRSADAIQKQAQSYERDGNEEEAFKFYYRHAILVMSKLVNHPDLKLPENREAWKKAQSDVNANLKKLEALKPSIKKRYELHLQRQKQLKEEREKWQKGQRNNTYNTLVGGIDKMSAPPQQGNGYSYGGIRELDPAKNMDLAVKLAFKEKRENRISRIPKSQFQAQPKRSTGAERLSSREAFFSEDSDDELSRNMVALGQRRQEASSKIAPRHDSQGSVSRTGTGSRAPHYPSVPKQTNKQDASWYGISPPGSSSGEKRPPLGSYQSSTSSIPPAPPPKEYFDEYGRQQKQQFGVTAIPPPVPQKLRTPSPPPGLVEAPDTSPTALDARNYTFKTTATTESGRALRTVFINPNLRSRFLTIALANTQDNLETCGILCGYLMSNAFFINKLVIPEQEATSDTCDTVNEGALFDYCDKENLMTLGWIHTHPTQTCFMSSRDLHTHGGYQVQLAESIAIVCAPRHEPSWGIFRLTDPPGLSTILNCKQTGIFHPHSEKHVYTDALQPGHVKELENLPFDVVDLRPGQTWI